MGQWVVLEEMRKRPEQKRGFFHIEMNLDSGTPKIKGLSCGIYLMEEKAMVNILEYFQFQIGQKWMFGNT